MMNTFMNTLSNASNFARTENGALAHKTTNSAVYDMFALGGAYRKRDTADKILLFKNAYEEDATLAMKCLFYLRDCRGGQGEREFFRVCFNWLCQNDPARAEVNLDNVSEYGRWDDLIYSTIDTPVYQSALNLIKKQLRLDIQCKTPSLLGKWMPSENASSAKTKRAAARIREDLNLSHKEYRKTLSELRRRINIVERLMSENRWDEIEFDKIPSRAGFIYKNAFARRDIIAKKYEKFAKDTTKSVNASVLYPYEVVAKAVKGCDYWGAGPISDVDRAMINKYWANLPDYLNGKDCSMMCVVDTSGSMTGSEASAPMNVAISLGMYCAERIGGPFHNHYISFASEPQLIKINGIDFVDKCQRIYRTDLCDNTNLEAVFDLLLNTALTPGVKESDIPKTIVVISDMQIDQGTGSWRDYSKRWTQDSASTEMEQIRQKWAAYCKKLPKLVYWNVNARGDANILDAGPNVSFVSGFSPVIFKSVLTGKTGWDLCVETLMADRYQQVV